MPIEINQSEPLDIKKLIQESIDDIEKNQDSNTDDWVIQNRKKRDTGESFTIIFTTPKTDTNLSNKGDLTIDENNLSGLGVYNDINYTKDSFSAISTLVLFPQDINTNKEERLLTEKFIDDKVFTISSNYNTNDHRYQISLKDINLSIPEKVKIETKGIQANGYYDQNNLTKQQSKFSIDLISITPLKADLFGEYIKMKKLQAVSKTEVSGENLSINYAISIDLLDMNANKEHSKIEKVNLSMSIGNLNLKAYENLLKFSQENAENLEDSEELQVLAMELFARSKDMYIEVSDLSLSGLMAEGKNLGPVRMSARVSLKGTKELIQKIAVAPETAIGAFSAKVRFQFPKDILQEVYKEDKSVGSMATLFAKYENESVVYDAIFKDGKLIINDQLFPLDGLQNMVTPGGAPQAVSAQINNNEAKNEIDRGNPEKQVAAEQNKHVNKYEQNSLHQAVLSKNVDEVKSALDSTSDINSVDKVGRTPLHYAAFNGDLEITRLLIEKGANINAVDKSKEWTPLFFAIFMKHGDMASLLIKEGADQTMKDKLGRTAEEYRDKK